MSGSWMVRSRTMNLNDGPETIHTLCRRDWDGFDRPDYYRVMEVEEHELDNGGFNAKHGRFENCLGWYSSDEGILAWMQKMWPSMTCINDLTIMAGDIDLLVGWIHENATGHWAFGFEGDATKAHRTFSFAFVDKADASAFKLRWA